MSAPKSNGFSQIPHGFHKRLAEMTGNQLKVWLAHRCMEGKEGESFPSLDKLVEYTGLNLHTVTDARKWLRASGWLTSSGQKHTTQGKFSIPIEHTAIPETVGGKTTSGSKTDSRQTACSKTTNGAGGKTTNGASGKTACGKTTTEVDPKAFEVDPKEVHPTPQPTQGLDGRQDGGNPPVETGKETSGKEKAVLTEDLMREGLQKTHNQMWTKWDNETSGNYEDKMPKVPPLTRCKRLFEEIYKRGITQVDDLPLLCAAYGSWFDCKYVTSFDAVLKAESAVEDGTATYVPQPIQCPLSMFRKELGVFLDEARLQLEE